MTTKSTQTAKQISQPKTGKKTSDDSAAVAPEYEEVDGSMIWLRKGKNGRLTDVHIANFTAKITGVVIVSDGIEGCDRRPGHFS